MIASFIRGLGPFQRILFFVVFSMFIGGLVTLVTVKLLKMLYGVSLPEDYELLQNFSESWVVGANKMLLLSQHVGFLVLPGALILGMVKGRNLLGVFQRNNWLWIVPLLALFSFPLINFLAYLNAQIPLGESMLAMEEDAARFTEAIVSTDSFSTLLVNIFIVALVPAIGEEIVFRGIIQGELHRIISKPWVVVLLSAAIFSALHMQFGGFIPRFFLGGILGFFYYRFKNLWLPILFHFTNNAFALVLIYLNLDSVDSAQELTYGPEEIGLLVLGVLVVGFILYRAVKTKNKQETSTLV